MTPLLFWGPYLAHKGVIEHRREKQRKKNYERWEGLRDDYDEQRRVGRASVDFGDSAMDRQSSLGDVYDAPARNSYHFDESDRPHGAITMRDQQEANDASTGWRPQEAWGYGDGNRRAVSMDLGRIQSQATGAQSPTGGAYRTTSGSTALPGAPTHGLSMLRNQKTGAAWDGELPPRLQVQRRCWNEDGTEAISSTQSSTTNLTLSQQASHQGSPTKARTPLRDMSTTNPLQTSSQSPDPISAAAPARPQLYHEYSNNPFAADYRPAPAYSRPSSMIISPVTSHQQDPPVQPVSTQRQQSIVCSNNPFNSFSEPQQTPAPLLFSEQATPFTPISQLSGAPTSHVRSNNPFEQAYQAQPLQMKPVGMVGVTDMSFGNHVPGGRMAELLERGY